jgi:caffeoyl-CoA O-methyltransferase
MILVRVSSAFATRRVANADQEGTVKNRFNTSRRTLITALLGLPAAGATATAFVMQRQRRSGVVPPSIPKNAAERRVLDVIADFDRTQRSGSLSVPFEDGRLLRILAESIGATRVIEIGTSYGYSGLWLALALRGTNGRLTTFEIDERRQARARANFERAGVLESIDLVHGDAHVLVSKVQGPIDMVFSDADKEGYLDYLHKLVPVLRPGGLFVTHNIEMAASGYLEAITTDSALESTLVNMGSGEIAVTLKKRS